MAEVDRIHDEIESAINHFYADPSQSKSKSDALTTLKIIYSLYKGAEDLRTNRVEKLEPTEGKTTIFNYICTNAHLLKTGGVFIPEEADGSHLKPETFITYTQIGMKFFLDRWGTAAPSARALMIAQLLTHDTLTYPRLVTYVQKWVPPERADLSLTITGWLFSDMNDAFTGQENSKNNRTTIADQIASKYKTMRDNKATYCMFWGNLLTMVDKAFSLGFKQEPLLARLRANRTQLHTGFMGYISTQEIDMFIDHCFEDVYKWVILGGDEDDD